jgi:hypothetical protein
MIVFGAGTHKRSHTVAGVAAVTGELLGEQTVPVGRRGFGALLRLRARPRRRAAWALEDCQHVSESLELIGQLAPNLANGQWLDRGGNRQINGALHRVIVTRARCHAQTRDYIARRRSAGSLRRHG